jgi:protein gp37
VPADIPVRFLSVEPLLSVVMPKLRERVGRPDEHNRVSWIIVGGES